MTTVRTRGLTTTEPFPLRQLFASTCVQFPSTLPPLLHGLRTQELESLYSASFMLQAIFGGCWRAGTASPAVPAVGHFGQSSRSHQSAKLGAVGAAVWSFQAAGAQVYHDAVDFKKMTAIRKTLGTQA